MTRNHQFSVAEHLERFLSWLVAAFGFASVFTTAYMAMRVYSPVWFADDWQVPIDYIALGGKYPLAKFWAQHNEHRVPFLKASVLADLFWLHGNHLILIVLNFCWQLAECIALSYFAIRLTKWSTVKWLTVIAIAAFFVVNPNQLQNTDWVFVAFFNTYAFAIVSVGSFCLYHVSGARRWLIVSILAGWLAGLNIASGNLALIILPITAFLLGLSYRKSAIFALPAAMAIGIFLIGYKSPSNATSPLTALHHPREVLQFLLAYFGESWHYIIPWAGDFLASVTIFGFAVFALYKFIWREPTQPIVVFLMSVAVICLASGFITALGRQGDGVAQAREGRYQTPAMLFWAVIALLCVYGISQLSTHRAAALMVVQVSFCGLVILEAIHLKPLYRYFHLAGLIRDSAGAALESGVDSLDWLKRIYPAPTVLPGTYKYLVTHRLMNPPLGMQFWMNTALTQQFRSAPNNSCLGATESISVVGMKDSRKELYAQGWAFYKGGATLSKIIATTEDGIIEGLGVLGFQRLDVPGAVPQVTEEESGWNLYALVPPNAQKLSVFAVIPNSNEVCELPLPKPIPAY